MCEEKLRWFYWQYIECLKSSEGRVLQSNREMCEAFRANFRDKFSRCPDVPVQEFRNYLADFPRLGETEAAGCEGVVTGCEVRNALKQVGLNKSLGLDGLPCEVYLRISHMFVPILTHMFKHWFTQEVIPGSITKGVITLKILARVLANRLQLIISDLIGPEQNYAVKGRSILVRQILEGIENDTEAELINFDQS